MHLHTPPTRLRAAKKQIPTDADIEVWTDGSFDVAKHLGASSAILFDHDDQIEEDAECYTNVSSSYEAELLALLIGLRKLIARNPRNSKIRIFTDSRYLATHFRSASLRYKAEEHDFCQVVSRITRLTIHNKIFIHWVSGNNGIKRNELQCIVDLLKNSCIVRVLHLLKKRSHRK